MAVPYIRGHQIIDLRNDANYYFEVAPQGDGQSRGVLVEVLDNGAPADFSVGSRAVIEGINAGGYNVMNNCSFEAGHDHNNYIDIAFTDGILDYAGVGRYTITVFDGSTFITSFPFNIVVIEAPVNVSRALASDSYQALQTAIATAMSANRWWVDEGTPSDPNTMGANLGDYYMDAITGKVYYTSMVSGSSSLQWEPLMNGSNQVAIQPPEPYRFYKTLPANTRSLTINQSNYVKGTLPSGVFNSVDASGSLYYYHVAFKCKDPNVVLKGNPTVTIGDNTVSVTLNFRTVATASTEVCVEITKVKR